jgi:hypothetical protein
MVNIAELLSKKVSYQSDTWAPITRERLISDILNEVRNGKYLRTVHFLRKLLAEGSQESYGIHKKALPCVTFCATFGSDRRRENLKEYNYILVVDIDKLSSDELIRFKKILLDESFVFAFWDSPSANGIKGLVYLSYNFKVDQANLDKSHKTAFKKLSKHFLDSYDIKLDESGNDITRLCFLSYDRDLVLKKDFAAFQVDESDVIEFNQTGSNNTSQDLIFSSSGDVLFKPMKKNNATDRKTMQAIIKYLKKNQLSITSTYEQWYKVAYAIADAFTYAIGEKYFLSLCKLDNERYHETNCKNILNYSYNNKSGRITFSTIVYLANQKGYLTNSQRGGVSKAAAN